MNQQPDKLFREKLEGYQRPAPPSAWEKIAAAQSKKNDKWLWLKIAASVALVAAAGYLLLPENKPTALSENTSPNTNTADDKKIEELPQVVEKPTEEIKTETAKPSVPSSSSTRVVKKNRSVESNRSSKDQAQHLTVVEENKKETETLQVPIETKENIASVESVNPNVEESAIKAEVKPQTMTLVYTAKDVEEYLDKKALAEATSDSKKSSTLKKLLKKAEDLTNNQDPFGELRQKKNEILALNFKNEKQRGQNK